MERCVINEFPKPYHVLATPYKQKGFSRDTLEMTSKSHFMTNVCKTIFIGDVSVGKTTIVNRFCHEKYCENYKATIGVDFEIQNFKVLNFPFSLQIWDTAGQERFKCIAQAYYRNANVIVIVFDMTKEETLKTASEWLKAASSVNKHLPLLFLVGSKCDLLSEIEFYEMERLAIGIAKTINAEYWSVSAKTGYSIVELFRRIAALSFDELMGQYLESMNSGRVPSSILKLNNSFIGGNNYQGNSKCAC